MSNIKDSRMEWMGGIPKGWNIIKGRYLFQQRSERGNDINLQLLSPTQKFGVIPQSLYEELSGMSTVKLNEKTNLKLLKTIHEGDYCISLRSFQGGFEYSKYEGVCSPAYQVFYPIVEIEKGYYKYLFKDQCFINKMNSYTLSLRDGKNIAFDDFGNTYLPVPPIEEQKLIASFLDEKCKDIDELAKDIQVQIEILEKYKRGVITEAVTRGLNSDVEMKDSEIEGIGKIPKEWKVKKIKYVSTIIRGGSPRPIERFISDTNEGYNWVKIGDTEKGNKYITKTETKIISSGLSKTRLVHPGTLLLTNSMSFGEPYIMGIDGCIHDGWVAFYDYKNIIKEFLYYSLLSNASRIQFEKLSDGGVVQNLNIDKVGKCYIVLPTEDEQKAITDYLDAKCIEIDGAIAEKKEQLEVLEQYKKSIIYEYVTGKREIG